MKLATEEETPYQGHLPEDPGTRPPILIRWAQQAAYFLASSKGITLVIGLITWLILSFILSYDYLSKINIQANGISSQTVFAAYPVDVVDDIETQQRVDLARQNVAPIYKPVQSINLGIRENLSRLFRSIQQLDADHEVSIVQKRKALGDLLGDVSAEDLPGVSKQLFSALHSNRWETIKTVTAMSLDNSLKMGVSTRDFFENKERILQESLPTKGLSPTEEETVKILMAGVLKPNRMVDEVSMERSRNEAADLVKPVVRSFKKGDRIIEEGERITPIQLQALEKMGRSTNKIHWQACLGVILLTGLSSGILWAYLYFYESRSYYKPTYAGLLSFLSILMVGVFKVWYLGQIPVYGFPIALFALTITIFTHPRVGILTTSLLVFLLGLTLKINIDLYYLAMSMLGSLVGVFVLSRQINMGDRAHLMLAGLWIGVANTIGLVALCLLDVNGVGIHWLDIGYQSLYSLFVSGLLSGILTLGMLPCLESLFKLITPYTLVELGNHNTPLLKRMQFEAPGTFHHSLMVASLSEAAAEAIGANPLLARVGSLYHDIGKMKRPLFFIENQAYFGVENPHDKLTPRLSKMVVTAHPRDGVEMARQYHLPEVLVKFMREHHGTLMAGYFYTQACLQEGEENVNKSQFRYPGPKPNIKETAIVMMADACESAVRALKSPTVAQIEERIEKIIRQRVDDGQFDQCPITFKEVNLIKETFMRILRGIQHNRIEYQQTVMRDLGRKLAAPHLQELPDIQQLSAVQNQSEKIVPQSLTISPTEEDLGGCC